MMQCVRYKHSFFQYVPQDHGVTTVVNYVCVKTEETVALSMARVNVNQAGLGNIAVRVSFAGVEVYMLGLTAWFEALWGSCAPVEVHVSIYRH